MPVGDETKASWTASVDNALAIPDAANRNAVASALQDGLNKVPGPDRWTDSRSSFWGARTGWRAWGTLYAELREARSDALRTVGTASPASVPAGSLEIAKAAGGGFVEGAAQGANTYVDAATSFAEGARDAVKNAGKVAWAVPFLVLAVLLLATYRKARS